LENVTIDPLVSYSIWLCAIYMWSIAMFRFSYY